MKFVTVDNYDYKATGTTFTEPSQTRQSDYEDINSTVERILRGEILPQIPDEFEYDDRTSVEDIFSEDHPFDAEDFDLGDVGSMYQDDIRAQMDNIASSEVTHQERELSGANQQSSSETNVPVDNLAQATSE